MTVLHVDNMKTFNRNIDQHIVFGSNILKCNKVKDKLINHFKKRTFLLPFSLIERLAFRALGMRVP